ncbi:MAG: UDP-N-acetylmuramoyl-L-alanine--D-glutamate ligase [Clostridia bacterium]|nr:UDP-N-acetylmuramoyl-L-alanine--D-glutamate ligase [Clostridia bacterium]
MTNPAIADFFKNTECVGFLGLGKSNLAILSLLPKEIRVILRSESPIRRENIPRGIKPYKIFDGSSAFENPEEDILFLSPSVRRERNELSKIWESGVAPSSDFELFLKINEKPLFSVTGSDGKSTTATLSAALLSTSRSKVSAIGNVGTPFVKSLQGRRGKYVVAELSSFSLRYAAPKSKRAVVTNITPNHLNWHSSYEEYIESKLSLLDHAEEKVISLDDRRLFEYGIGKEVFAATSAERSYKEIKEQINASVFYTSELGFIKRNGEELFPVSMLKRREFHNIKNLLSALALTDGYVSFEWQKKTAFEFGGLPHRLEEFATHKGVRYINSSIDTSPARCAESLSSLDRSVIVILGGKSKGCGYETLREPLSKHARLAVITGENRKEIYEDIRGSTETVIADDFEDAVLYAASVAKEEDTVLLCPASTSYDCFSSFEERGNKFKVIISDYIKNH